MNNNENSLNIPNTFEKMNVLKQMLELINLIKIVGVDNIEVDKENPINSIERKLSRLEKLLEEGSTIEELNLLINIINLEIERAKYDGIDIKDLISKYKNLPVSRFEDLDDLTDEGSEIVNFFIDNFNDRLKKILPAMDKFEDL